MFLKILQKAEIFLISSYKHTLSPLLQYFLKGGCRYEPNCSEYSIQAIKKYGPINGFMLSLVRFMSCNPLSKHPRNYPLI